MQTEMKTKVFAVDTDENGNKKTKGDGELATYITSEKAFNARLKDATDKKLPLPEMLASGTFSYKQAQTVDEAVELCGGSGVGEYEHVDVFLRVFNYGASLRQDNEATDLLKSDSYVPQDGAIDVSYACAQVVERAKQSPEEKSAKILGITPEQLRQALLMIKGQGASA